MQLLDAAVELFALELGRRLNINQSGEECMTRGAKSVVPIFGLLGWVGMLLFHLLWDAAGRAGARLAGDGADAKGDRAAPCAIAHARSRSDLLII